MADLLNRKALMNVLNPNEPDPLAPPAGDLAGPPIANTGIAGGLETKVDAMPQVTADMAAPAAAAAAPDYTKLGKYADKMTGYNMDKFNRPYDQQSEKYKVGLVNSNFDPNQGITPEYLNALKSLNIADFSGSGDKLTAMNGRNGGRYGAGGTADTIVGLKSGGNAKWGYWTDPALEAQGAQGQHAQGVMHPMDSGAPLNPQLTGGDPMAQIQAALAQYSKSPNIAALLAQLGQGQ